MGFDFFVYLEKNNVGNTRGIWNSRFGFFRNHKYKVSVRCGTLADFKRKFDVRRLNERLRRRRVRFITFPG